MLIDMYATNEGIKYDRVSQPSMVNVESQVEVRSYCGLRRTAMFQRAINQENRRVC